MKTVEKNYIGEKLFQSSILAFFYKIQEFNWYSVIIVKVQKTMPPRNNFKRCNLHKCFPLKMTTGCYLLWFSNSFLLIMFATLQKPVVVFARE
jgi:hypothetical protein